MGMSMNGGHLNLDKNRELSSQDEEEAQENEKVKRPAISDKDKIYSQMAEAVFKGDVDTRERLRREIIAAAITKSTRKEDEANEMGNSASGKEGGQY